MPPSQHVCRQRFQRCRCRYHANIDVIIIRRYGYGVVYAVIITPYAPLMMPFLISSAAVSQRLRAYARCRDMRAIR